MNSIEQLKSGLTVGHFGLGMRGEHAGSPVAETYDGDTLKVRALGNLSVRFLGIDSPEIKIALPGDPGHFVSLNDPKWEAFLTDPFSSKYPPLVLDEGLKADLMRRLGTGAAKNHYTHAKEAEKSLEVEIMKDRDAMGWTDEGFEFFLAFGREIMDRYGRLLAYINRKDPSQTRPLDYNTRQLKNGVACPYAIWMNVGNAACNSASLTNLVLEPFNANTWANKDKYVKQAREFVASARQKKLGIFSEDNSLRIEPFEVRYLAGRRVPDRWVIDLSRDDDILVAPQNYYLVKMEDRLFIPGEYIPLFESKGWKRQMVARMKVA